MGGRVERRDTATESVKEQLRRHEGLKLKMYKCPAGYWTIGYGHNIEVEGISQKIANILLEDKVNYIASTLSGIISCWDKLNQARRDALINMAFNMGIAGLLKWKNTLKAMKDERWEDAYNLIISSLWHGQVGKRAEEIAKQILEGRYQDGSKKPG
jgi:lysozyme